MTTFAATAASLNFLFAAAVALCADFCAGARQGGYPPSPQAALTGQRR